MDRSSPRDLLLPDEHVESQPDHHLGELGVGEEIQTKLEH